MADITCSCRQCRHFTRPASTHGGGRRAGRAFERGIIGRRPVSALSGYLRPLLSMASGVTAAGSWFVR